MWIFNREGFFSVVQDRENAKKMIVRARFEGDLEKVIKEMRWRSIKVEETLDADYAFRIRISRDKWAKYVAYSALMIDYDNFKGSLGDWERHNIYLSVWGVLKTAADKILGLYQPRVYQGALFDDYESMDRF